MITATARVERFIDRLYANWGRFQQPPFHPKWRDVNLSATVPGWTRYSVSEQILQRVSKGEAQAQQRDFEAFLTSADKRGVRDQAEREALFREFLQWRERQTQNNQSQGTRRQ